MTSAHELDHLEVTGTPLRRRNVNDALAASVRDFGDKAAFTDARRTVTYRDLDGEVARLAGGLREAGVEQGEPVGVMLDNSLDFVLVWLALSRLGALEVPINTAYKGAILQHVLDDVEARIVIAEAGYVSRLASLADQLPALQGIIVRGNVSGETAGDAHVVTDLDSARAADPVEPLELQPWDLIGILYTSGTTGLSKGVRVTHAHAYTYCDPAWWGFASADDRYLVTMPMFHIGGQWMSVYNTIIAGATAIIPDRFSVSSFWDTVREHDITHTMMVGAMANFLFRQPPSPHDADNPLQRVFMAPVIQEVEEFSERFGVAVGTGYGSTEGSGPTCAPFGQAVPQAIGWLRPDFEARIVDDRDVPVPRGSAGELILRPRLPWTITDGYHGLPEETVKVWRNLWFHTGDVVFQGEDGQLFFVDRKRDAIRRRGENISSFEVEAAVNSHPAVLESAAVGIASADTEEEIKVAVVLKDGHSVGFDELIGYLADELPYFMVPRYLEVLDDLPKTPTDKIRKEPLRASGVSPGTWDREAAGIEVKRDG